MNKVVLWSLFSCFILVTTQALPDTESKRIKINRTLAEKQRNISVAIKKPITEAHSQSILYQSHQAFLNRFVTRSTLSGRHDSLEDYAKKCDAATGITVPLFSCSNGTEVPGQGIIPATTQSATHCDRPNVLNGHCDPGSKFQVLPGRSADAVAVAHCRKVGLPIGGELYNDIAVIQYNKKNGALCFYQALTNLPGTNIPAPRAGDKAKWSDNLAHWISPEGTEAIGCTGCHDNGGFIRSEYLAQLKPPGHVLPNSAEGFDNANTPVRYVGLDYATNRSWSIETSLDPDDSGSSCTACHRLAVPNRKAFGIINGTAAHFANIATAENQTSKNPHNPSSPIWMRLGQITYKKEVERSASRYQHCAIEFFNSDFMKAPVGCNIKPLGVAWDEPNYGHFAAIWSKTNVSNWVARHGLTSEEYQKEFDNYTSQGMRLKVVDGYEVDGQARYAAMWEKAPSSAWISRHGMSGSDYQIEFDKNVRNGFRLVWVNGYNVGGSTFYAAIWDKSPGGAWIARHGMTSADYQSEFDKYVSQGYKLKVVSGYASGNEARYAAIWEKGSSGAWIARHGISSIEYQAEFDKNVSKGFNLIQVSSYKVGNQVLYAAIWDKTSPKPFVARHGLTATEYQSEFDTETGKGLQLVNFSAY